MRNRDIEKLLENAVADALGLPAPHSILANRPVRARKRSRSVNSYAKLARKQPAMRVAAHA